jgi:hypothetical protein
MKSTKEQDVINTYGIAIFSENPSYPWILVDREIISPNELCALSDDDLRERWGYYAKPNEDGVFERIWSCRSYAREAINPNGHLSILIPSPFPIPMSTLVEPVVLLFWPPQMEGDAVEYIAHWGSGAAAIDGLTWLLDQNLPIYNGPRATLHIFGGSHQRISLNTLMAERWIAKSRM